MPQYTKTSQGTLEGKRGIGRPRRSWQDDVKDWRGTTTERVQQKGKEQDRVEGHFTSISKEMTPDDDVGGKITEANYRKLPFSDVKTSAQETQRLMLKYVVRYYLILININKH